MTQHTDDQTRTLFQRATPVVTVAPDLVDRAVRVGRMRRRRRQLGYGVGVAAAATAVGFSLSALAPGNGPAEEQLYAGQPTASAPAPGPDRLPTVDELSATLVSALPGPSTPTRSEARTHGPLVERTMSQGAVAAWAYEQPGERGTPMDGAALRTYMEEMCSLQSPVSGCTATAEGWALWSVSKPDVPDVDDASLHAQVRFVQRDGLVITLDATNHLDPSTPTSDAPVLSRDQLVTMATTVDWFPST
jgi:hypothetical protein